MIANTLPPVLANNQVHSTRNARAPKNPRTIRVRPWPLCTIDGTWNPHHTTPEDEGAAQRAEPGLQGLEDVPGPTQLLPGRCE